jgi:hypothetical protein
MEYVTSRNVTNGDTSGNGVLCVSTPLITSCNNKGIVGNGVFSWVRPEAQTRRRSSQTVVHRGGEAGGGAPIVVSRCVSTPSRYEIDASLRGCDPGTRKLMHLRIYGVGSVTRRRRREDTADWKCLVCVIVNSSVCKLAIALELLVVTTCKCEIYPITSPNPVCSQCATWQYDG